jgi:hypothetical protein
LKLGSLRPAGGFFYERRHIAKPRIDPTRRALIEKCIYGVATGKSFNHQCEKYGIETASARKTVAKDSSLSAQYADAKMLQADAHGDLILDTLAKVADGKLEARAAEVVCKNLQWLASKLQPSVYGERLNHVMSADGGFLEALKAVESISSRPAIEAPIIDVTPDE